MKTYCFFIYLNIIVTLKCDNNDNKSSHCDARCDSLTKQLKFIH